MCIFVVSVLLSIVAMVAPAYAFGVIDCPKPVVQTATDVSAKIQSGVRPLAGVSAQTFDAKAEVVTRDLFHEYSDSGTVALAHSTISIFCQIIATSSLSDAEKLDHLYRLEEWITRISGHSAPTSTYWKATCAASPSQVLKPVQAVFNAWATRDLDRYMSQWAPAAIQRSKYYARELSEIASRRSHDFAKYAAVSVISVNPRILFVDGAKARISNTYSMRFVRYDGRVINETNIDESYILECSKDGNRWMIRENNDYSLKAY
ncbi:hypothetical protein [Methylocystis sp.]|uniref:hypothetical protein n=1 Tax=Methylocystis sp. TaxID=1911079 RepID=UPI003D0A4A4A